MADAAAPPIVYTRHPKYWETETRTLVYVVESTTYHFALSVLKMMSPPLTAIFDIPPSATITDKDGNVTPAEGTEANPIRLPGITVKELDDFLAYFFKSALRPEINDLPIRRREEICVNLLTVACLWDIAEAKDYAKGVLKALVLPPAHMLAIARQFAIHEWVQDIVKELLPICGSFDTDTALKIGPITLNILYQAKTAIDQERLFVAHSSPKLVSYENLGYGECNNHQVCERSVRENWWNLVGKKVLHPSKPMPLDAICDHLNKVIFPGMSPKCHENMVNKWTTNVFEADALIAAAVEGVERFHKCCRLS